MVEQRHHNCYQVERPSVYLTVDPRFSALIQKRAAILLIFPWVGWETKDSLDYLGKKEGKR